MGRCACTSAGFQNGDFSALAPILCAAVTTYKGIKETEARPGEWIVISGVGRLRAWGDPVRKSDGPPGSLLVDVTSEKLALARALGAEITVNGRFPGAVDEVLTGTGGGAHGVLVTAVSVPAFGQAGMVRRKGTVSLVGLPPGDFPTPIFDASSSASPFEGRSWERVRT